MARIDHDVVMIGAGMVGSACASLLARAGLNVALVEAHQPQAFDPQQPVGLRVSALSPGSVNILKEAGAWKGIQSSRHCVYQTMQVEDRDQAQMVFDAANYGLDGLGVIVENALTQWALWQQVSINPQIELFCPDKLQALENHDDHVRVSLTSGQTLRARLAVAADGATSRARQLLGIGQQQWEYNQSGVVSVVRAEQSNPGVAWQRFLDDGPLAFLPLKDGSSSIVWSVPTSRAAELKNLQGAEFCEQLTEASGAWLGAVQSCGPRASFPLAMRLSESYFCERTVLLGDAAHVVHPLAGQGVNMGLQDAAALVEVLLQGEGNLDEVQSTLRRFERWRRSESELMAKGFHGIRALFSPTSLGWLRKLGMSAVSRSWSAKNFFIERAVGRYQDAPRLAQGEQLTDLLRP